MTRIESKRDLGPTPGELWQPLPGELEAPKDYAERRVEYFTDDITRIKRWKGIDSQRVVRGLLLGDLTGDVIGPLHGANTIVSYIVQYKRQKTLSRTQLEGILDLREKITNGVACTWHATNALLQVFGDRLDPSSRQTIQDALDKHRDFALEATYESSNHPEIEGERLIQGTSQMYQDFIKIRDQKSSDDTKYALGVVRKKQRKPPLLRWRGVYHYELPKK